MASKGEQDLPPTNEDMELLWKPFALGWRRELVFRSDSTAVRPRSDCYYYTPAGKKLRSLREIQMALDETSESEMDISSFSLRRGLLGAGPPGEVERQAGTPGAPPRDRYDRERSKRSRLSKVLKSPPRAPQRNPSQAERRVNVLLRKPTSLVAGEAAAPAQRKLHVMPAAGGLPRRTVVVVPSRPRTATPAVLNNGTLPLHPEGRAAPVGTKLLKILTKGQRGCSVLTDEPRRKLKMMVKGEQRYIPTARLVSAESLRTSAAAALERLLSIRPWRLAVVGQNGRMELISEPTRCSAMRIEYRRLLREQADSGDADPQTLQIGRVRQYAACSLFCSRTKTDPLRLPSLRCVGCYCLSHPGCVGLVVVAPPDRTVAPPVDFVCLDCFDRLRHRADRRLSLPIVCSDEGSPERAASPTEPYVQEIVVVANKDESGALVAAAAERDRSKLITLDDGSDTTTISDDGSVEFLPKMRWSGERQPTDTDARTGGDMRGPPSLVRGNAPPAPGSGPRRLFIGPPRLAPAIAPPPPPLQRAPASKQRTVVVSRVTVTPAGVSRAGVPVTSPAGGQERPRRHSGCKVRVTGPPVLAGAAGAPPGSAAAAARRPTTVVVVSPTTTVTATLNPAPAPAPTSARPKPQARRPITASVVRARRKAKEARAKARALIKSCSVHLPRYKIQEVATPSHGVRGDGPPQEEPKATSAGETAADLTARSVSQAPRVTPATPVAVAAAAAAAVATGSNVIKVTVKCQPQTNGRASTVSVGRPSASADAVPGDTNGLTEREAGRRSSVDQRTAVVSVKKTADRTTPARAAKTAAKTTVKTKPSPRSATVKTELSDSSTAVKTESSPSSVKVKTEPSAGAAAVKTEPSLSSATVKKEPSSPSAAVKTELSPGSSAAGRRLTRARKRASVTDTDSYSPVAKKRSWRAPSE